MAKRPSLASNMKALSENTSPKLEAGKIAASTRLGMKKLLTPVEPALHMRLKILAAKRSTTLEALTREALQHYLAKHDDPA